jgi:hypothetical protein
VSEHEPFEDRVEGDVLSVGQVPEHRFGQILEHVGQLGRSSVLLEMGRPLFETQRALLAQNSQSSGGNGTSSVGTSGFVVEISHPPMVGDLLQSTEPLAQHGRTEDCQDDRHHHCVVRGHP